MITIDYRPRVKNTSSSLCLGELFKEMEIHHHFMVENRTNNQTRC